MFLNLSPIRKRIITLSVIAATILVSIVLGAFWLQAGHPAQSQEVTFADLGVTYFTLTGDLVDYYDLHVEKGAFVTEVSRDSIGEKIGIMIGDVILSFNGVPVSEKGTLLSIMRGCPVGERVILEIWRQSDGRFIELSTSRGEP